jgi:hypothetical protein
MKKAILIIATVFTAFMVMSFQTPKATVKFANGVDSGMDGLLFNDTTPVKKNVKAKPDTTFYLGGKAVAFQFLYKAIVSPDDITNNDRKKLVEWINTAFPVVDTVGKK